MTIQANSDFQFRVLSTPADIAVTGGSAGPGKSAVLVIEGSRNIGNPRYGGLLLRRTMPMIDGKEGLFDKTIWVYKPLGGIATRKPTIWRFPRGGTIRLDSIQYEKDLDDFQGTEYDYIGFDELTQFTETMFWFMYSRARSTNGIKPYMRATCNPDAESWVKDLVSWYIGDDGYAIPARDGVLRYFIRLAGVIIWGNSPQEVYEQVKHHPDFMKQVELQAEVGNHWSTLITSFTYIHGSVYNNKTLMKENPSYIANLMGLPEAEKRRFLDGNWNASEDGMNLVEYDAVTDLFKNEPTASTSRYITCDAAQFGRDFMVIIVWQGWDILEIRVRRQSEARDIVADIKEAQLRWGVFPSNVIVDNDGVGSSTVKLGQFNAFRANDAPFINKDIKHKENYHKLKDQCAYYAAEKINMRLARCIVTDGNVFIHNGVKYERIRRMKVGSEVKDIADIIKQELRTWKRVPRADDKEPIKLNSKEEQKVMLGGRSPDFADNFIFRSWFDLRPKAGTVTHRA